MKAKTSEFIQYIKSKLGMAYLWGGQGETVFDQLRKLAKIKDQSDANTVKMLTFMQSKGVKDLEMYDCSGLAVSYLMKVGAIEYDMTADGMYRKCAKITIEQARPGDMVFLLNKEGKATHVGFIVDHGTTMHALNQTRGVISEKLSLRKWLFGRPDFCLEYDLEPPKIDITTLQPGDSIELYESIKGYNTADNAKKATNSTVTYPAGTYYVYKIYNGSVNITKVKGKPGAWVIL